MKLPFDLIGWVHRHRPNNAGRFVMPYLVAVLTIVALLGAIQAVKTRDFTNELRNAQVKACEHSPVKRAVIQLHREAIVQPRELAQAEALFPGVAPGVIMRLVEVGNARHKRRIEEIRSIDCVARYP